MRRAGLHTTTAYSSNGGLTPALTCDIRAGYENQHCMIGNYPFRASVRAENAHSESAWRNSPNIGP